MPKKQLNILRKETNFLLLLRQTALQLGKGVIIPENLDDAIAGVKEIMEDKIFGASGNNIVVEEFLTGPEVSVLAFTDGKCVKPMVSSMDISVRLTAIKVLIQAEWELFLLTLIIRKTLQRNVWIKYLFLQLML